MNHYYDSLYVVNQDTINLDIQYMKLSVKFNDTYVNAQALTLCNKTHIYLGYDLIYTASLILNPSELEKLAIKIPKLKAFT